MKVLDRIVDTLPPPYAVDADAVLTQLLDSFALEVEAVEEDLDRLRRTHWVGLAYRLTDVARLGRLVGVEPFPVEGLGSFRARLLALTKARLGGAVGPNEIRLFVYEYLSGAEQALQSTFVPGLALYEVGDAFREHEDHPAYRPLELVENPERPRRSRSLAEVRGRVPYLHRFQERNDGLTEAVVTAAITGFPEGRTAVPLVVNITTGDLVGYAGVLGVGRRLTLEPAEPGGRPLRALLDGTHDVTERVFSVSGFEPGIPFTTEDLDAMPLLPRLALGTNDFVYLSVGLYDVRGLDRVFFAIADDELREGVYNATSFDHALFPSGQVAHVELAWIETEPASFEVRVPRGVVVEAPELGGLSEEHAYGVIANALSATVHEIRAAGVRAAVRFEPFLEEQDQRVRATVPWVVLPGEHGSAGGSEELALGARFDEAALGIGRLE